MVTLKSGETIYPGIEDEVAVEQAKGTISNIIDAIVELVTNCDDSYSSLEQEGKNNSGKIDIFVKKTKSGILDELIVSDEASGMTPDQVEKVIRYGKKTSAFFSGKSVRGFFGRGLKECFIALGSGEICSVSSGKRTRGRYYFDPNEKKLAWETFDDGLKTDDKTNTKITIVAQKQNNVKCYDFDKLIDKIRNHFSLRDILRNKNRIITVTMERNGKIKGPDRLVYQMPHGQQIENRKFYLKGFGVADFKLFESLEELYFSRNDPESQAGILLKTSSAILENQLFGFDNDPVAHYFFGEVRCPGIFEKLKAGEKGIIRSDRKGLYWSHDYCAELEKEIKTILNHHIDRKKKLAQSLEKKEKYPEERANKFLKLCKKLNFLSSKLLGEIGPGPGHDPENLDISKLTIYPSEAISPPGQERAYSIYNQSSVLKKNSVVKIFLDDPKGKFELKSNAIFLRKHPKRDDLAIGYFKIKGFHSDDKTGIIVKQENEEDLAEFSIGPEKKTTKTPGPNPPPKQHGGLFKEIVFNAYEKNPRQRVFFEKSTGNVIIYVNFTGIYPYLKNNGDGTETERGSILLSELIAEAFCKETARRKADRDVSDLEGKLDAYINLYNEHLKLSMPIIQSIFIEE